MNEELIKQIAREWAAQQCERMARRMRAREAEADELTAADRYRRGENDALLSREFELLRLYHARAVAPLVEAVGCIAAPDEASMTGWSDECIRGWAYAAARITREALAAFGKGEE